MSLAKLLREFAPVEQLQTPGYGWDAEFRWLDENHPRRMERLRRSVERLGIEEPIRLCYGHPDCGTALHVVDGHHRVAVARGLGLRRVPVGDAWEEGSDWFLYSGDGCGDDPA